MCARNSHDCVASRCYEVSVLNTRYNRRLLFLALALSALWFAGGAAVFFDSEARDVWSRVREGQGFLWQEQLKRGVPLSEDDDKLKTGFIGAEWSPLTTTLGDIRAKRTACDPMWAVQFLHWFDTVGLKEGDRVVIYSSASFPGLLYSALVAAETRGLNVMLGVSLGASTWGANRAEFPWPLMASSLRSGGYIKTRTAFYTLGGVGEMGQDMPEQARALFRELAEKEGVPVLEARNIGEMIRQKTDIMLKAKPALFISIGGSNANMGESDAVLGLPPGLLLPGKVDITQAGDGVIGGAVRSNIPALHLLNISGLASECGIPYDPDDFADISLGSGLAFRFFSLIGITLFALVLFTHRRWEWRDG